MENNTQKLRIRVLLPALLALQIPIAVDAAQSFRTRTSTTDLVTVESMENDVRSEIEFGRELAAIILGQIRLEDDEQIGHYLNLVGGWLARHSQRPELKFHFALLDSEEINAYTAPGGYIFVTKGALRIMRDESELAAVLAHEIAHTTQKHIVKELKIKGSDDSAESSLSKLFSGFGDTARIAVNQALDKANELLFTTGLKQEDEFEADQVGTLLLTEAGYDPTALYRYLIRVKSAKSENKTVLYKTHPSFDLRLEKIEELLSEEQLSQINSATYKQRFNKNIQVQ